MPLKEKDRIITTSMRQSEGRVSQNILIMSPVILRHFPHLMLSVVLFLFAQCFAAAQGQSLFSTNPMEERIHQMRTGAHTEEDRSVWAVQSCRKHWTQIRSTL